MPTKLDQNIATAVSTNAEVSYLFSNFLEETTNPVYGTWVDPVAIQMENLQDLKKNAVPIRMDVSKKLTTLCYEKYGTTSLWGIVLYLNGILHPHEIDEGVVLLFPLKSDIDSLIAQAKQQSTKSVANKLVSF